jgi:hypothetical protein
VETPTGEGDKRTLWGREEPVVSWYHMKGSEMLLRCVEGMNLIHAV